MAKFLGAKCRACRRASCKLFLKGDRCFTKKCSLDKRKNKPGQHGTSKSKLTEFGLQLREKQKCKRMYGILENQLKNYYLKSKKMVGITGSNIMKFLEHRLDNVIYKSGFASSISQARQLVTHAHFCVNGKKCDIASYQIKINDIITVKQSKQNNKYFETIKHKTTNNQYKWFNVDMQNLIIKIVDNPEITQEMLNYGKTIAELYSR